MAERRMFSKTIIDSDAFLDLPLSAQTLYFHLSMRADDDGFLNNARKIQRMIGASDDDMAVLISEGYIIRFDSGVIAIKHWKIHNYIRGDRKKQTNYVEEMSLLAEKSNGAYSLKSEEPLFKCQSSDSQMSVKCRHRLGKDSIELGKDSVCNNINIYNNKADEKPAENTDDNTEEKPAEEKVPHHTHISVNVYKALCSKYGKAFVDSKVDKAYNDKALIKFCEQDYKRKRSSGANKNKFNKFEQRDYDLNALEERLTSIPPPTAGND